VMVVGHIFAKTRVVRHAKTMAVGLGFAKTGQMVVSLASRVQPEPQNEDECEFWGWDATREQSEP